MAQRKVEQLLMKLSSYDDFPRTRMTSRGLLSLAKWLKWNQGPEKGRCGTRGTDHPPVQCGRKRVTYLYCEEIVTWSLSWVKIWLHRAVPTRKRDLMVCGFFRQFSFTYKTISDAQAFVSCGVGVMRAVSTCQSLWACAPLCSVLRVPELRVVDRGSKFEHANTPSSA
jgi:hypothetical protein